MKQNMKTYFTTAAIGITILLTGCTSDDDFGRYPEGSIPLSIGNVGVAGVETATRAATTENASGFTGIRKTTFVNGDALALTLSNDGGTTTTSVTATLTGGAWVLNPAKNFVIPGTTTIKAAYTPAATTGMKADLLEATTYTMDGQKVTFAMKHVHAMIDITYTAGVAPTSITVTANNGTADENLSTVLEEEADGTKHFRSIASAGTVKSLTAVINGQNYVATLATPLTVEANKRYPIALTFKENLLTATVGTATLNWNTGGAGELLPSGYDRYISTPEDLAQFAKDVNDDITSATHAKVLQMADIDLAQLKTAADANTANPGKNYTYTATAENWVGIGSAGKNFTGTYNGNGHTISNMKITASTSNGAGLFRGVSDATLTGIHLRGVSINVSSSTDCGPLCVSVVGATKISLCSATGDATVSAMANTGIGGLCGRVGGTSFVTRCNSAVNLTWSNAPGSPTQAVGGLIAILAENATVAGCSYTGNIDAKNNCDLGGFVGTICANARIFGCQSGGTMTVDLGTPKVFIGGVLNEVGISVSSCFSTTTATYGSFGIADATLTYTDCAWTGTSTDAIAGVTYSVAVADLYDKITASGASSPATVKTLHWSAADGYTTTEVSDTWHASAVWKDNGTAAPTVDMTYEGGAPLYNGQRSNLLAIAGQSAYWVAPVDAATNVAWNDVNFNTVCPAGWHVPTKDEFDAMMGGGTMDPASPLLIAISTAFPAIGIYWSSTAEDASKASVILVNNELAILSSLQKTETGSDLKVRCVRKK